MRRDTPVHPNPRAIRSLSATASDGPSILSANLRPRTCRSRRSGAAAAGRLRMTRDFTHLPVMRDEVVALIENCPHGVILDATVGGAGHAGAILSASARHRLIGIDRDPEAVRVARERLSAFGARARVVLARFDELGSVLDEEAPSEPLVAALFDLGVSSPQIDVSERGFSYRSDAPLDMRMGPDAELSAAVIVNEWPEEALAALFAEHGEARHSRRIARAVVAARPLATTTELAELVQRAVPAGGPRRRGHPATRVFQALRVTVNEELTQLPIALEAATRRLAPGGRSVVISYHSGEDRLVKQVFNEAAAGWCRCPVGLPCVCGAQPAVRLLNRGAQLATKAEVSENPRASSARLRAVERLDARWRRPESEEDE